jgi:DNA processing protein
MHRQRISDRHAAAAGQFPARNRIISGLSAGVLVVEAAAQSGSLITARQAAEQGRRRVCDSRLDPRALAKGCHMLIREGAQLVDTARDVLEALALSPLLARQAARLASADISQSRKQCHWEIVHASRRRLLDALGHDPVEPDVLLARLGCSPGELAARLLVLELSGHLERLPGGLIQRIGKG